jgi:hypothetical protein
VFGELDVGYWMLNIFSWLFSQFLLRKWVVECSAPNLLTDLLRLGSKGINHGDDAVQGCAPPVMFVGL